MGIVIIPKLAYFLQCVYAISIFIYLFLVQGRLVFLKTFFFFHFWGNLSSCCVHFRKLWFFYFVEENNGLQRKLQAPRSFSFFLPATKGNKRDREKESNQKRKKVPKTNFFF